MIYALQCAALAALGAVVAWFAALRIQRAIASPPTEAEQQAALEESLGPKQHGELFEPLLNLAAELESAAPEKLRATFTTVAALPYATWQRGYSLDLVIRRWLAVDAASAIEALSTDPTLLPIFVASGSEPGGWLAAIGDPEAALGAVTRHVPVYHQARLIEQLVTLSGDAARVAAAIDAVAESAIRLRVGTAFVQKFSADPTQAAAVQAWAEKNPFLAAACGYAKP